MRLAVIAVLSLGTLWSQTLTEFGAAAAGSTTGSVAGKQVSKGITSIFGNVSKQLAGAAKQTKQTKQAQPVLQVGQGVPQAAAASADGVNVPPPPPLPGDSPVVHRAATPPAAPPEPVYTPPVAPAPPPPVVTRADLASVAPGMGRQQVLDMGAPASRITMYQDGHLVEIYRYAQHDAPLGVVRLSDGAVSQVEVQP